MKKSKLVIDKISMLGANLGEVNPLPDIIAEADIHTKVKVSSLVPEEDAKYINYGGIDTILPYTAQDGYDRVKTMKEYTTIVLENDYIKATFIPEFGGRLWSLIDKVADKELLYVNKVFQPANFAVRNAWISGGVEWNIGMTGHSPFTLSPLFVEIGELEDLTPVLKMYEWERIRQVTYEITAYLPHDSKFLFVKVKLINTTDKETPIYWWSNIAVPETTSTRVIAPAENALCFGYGSELSYLPVPIQDGVDRSYSAREKNAMDIFFSIEKQNRKWVTSINENGYGLIQTSTDLLKGRKLFLWGNGKGSETWQEFLSVPNHKYAEIQAGLAKTQMEHVPMPGSAQWEWLEAYGPISSDAAKTHSEDWKLVCNTVENELELALPREFVEAELIRINEMLKNSNLKLISNGSGWGALEKQRRISNNEPISDGLTCFPDESITQSQQYWVDLLSNNNSNNLINPQNLPADYIVGDEWLKILQANIKNTTADWQNLLQQGIIYFAKNEVEKAHNAFLASLECEKSPWALTNLGLLEQKNNNTEKSSAYLVEAVTLLPHKSIAFLCLKNLLTAKKFDLFAKIYDCLPKVVTEISRIKLTYCTFLSEICEYEKAIEIISSGFVLEDIREGELSLSKTWILLHKKMLMQQNESLSEEEAIIIVNDKFPVPLNLDFRMQA